MSLRVFQQAAAMRVMLQGMKDQTSKCESNLRSLKDTASSSSSSKQARRFTSTAVDSGAFKAANNEIRLKQAEESLRTVMYLSCWGPN